MQAIGKKYPVNFFQISEDYYHIIKPYVAKEYLLLNNQDENKTTVENRYFFEV